MNRSEEAPERRQRNFLMRNAMSLLSTSVVTSGLGFVYWTLAARMFAVSDIGESTTAIAAMSLIAPFTVLGFGTALITKLPTMRSGRAELVSTAVAICALVACLIALACALLLPGRFLGLPGVGESVGVTALFVGGVVAHSVGLLLDSALLSAVGGGVQLRRNAIHAVVKLALLVVFAITLHRYGSLSIYASWFIAAVTSILVIGVGLIRDHRLPLGELRPRLSSLDGLHFHAVKHHMLNLSLAVPVFSMPIIANVILGSEQAGYLYATWSLAGFVFTLPISMSIALFAAGAKDSSKILRELRFSLRLSMAATLAANLVILPFGAFVLGIFGPAYAENGHTVLIILCLGGFGLVIRDHHMAIARITGDVGREGVLMLVASVGELLGAAIGAYHGGLIGLSIGWVAAVTLEGFVFGPRVWRTYRGHLTLGDRTTPAADRDGEVQPRQSDTAEG